MHILTKFLVILAAILSILLSGLAIALTGNIDAVRSEFQSMKAATAAANAAASEANSRAGRERELYQQDLSAKTNDISQLGQAKDALEGEVKGLAAEVKRLELAEESYAARIDQFTALVDAHVQLAQARQKEIETLRQRELESARKEIELADRINDLEGELDVSRENIRALQEQLVDVRQGAGGSLSGSGGGGYIDVLRAPNNLRARITGVQNDSDGNLLVSIDAGTSDQLRTRMKINIVRDGAYVGSAVLDTVDINESVARVTLLRDDSVTIQAGDLVTASAP